MIEHYLSVFLYIAVMYQILSSRKASTHKDYQSWLTPFVKWLIDKAQGKPLTITSRTIA